MNACELCGARAMLTINGLCFCVVHADDGLALVLRLECFNKGAPMSVAERGIEWARAELLAHWQELSP